MDGNRLACATGCPFGRGPSAVGRFAMPAGYLHRVADVEGEVDETKRNLLKLAAVAGILGVGAGAGVGEAIELLRPTVPGLSSYPTTQLFDVDGSPLTVTAVEGTAPDFQGEYNVATSDDLLFNYPLTNEPNFFLNLYPANGQPPSSTNPGAANVPGGIGTNGSIVAYSALCQHLACPAPSLSYYPPGTCSETFAGRSFYIHCSCHGSTYDAANSAANLTGPAVLPLPQVILKEIGGYIYAVGEAGPPVIGHNNTLQGGNGVGDSSRLTTDTPVIVCTNFPS